MLTALSNAVGSTCLDKSQASLFSPYQTSLYVYMYVIVRCRCRIALPDGTPTAQIGQLLPRPQVLAHYPAMVACPNHHHWVWRPTWGTRPSMLVLPEIPEIPEIPGCLEFSEIPEFSEFSEFPEFPEFPEF